MSYLNAYYQSSKRIVHLWDEKKGYIKIPYVRYGYVKDPNGSYVNLFGNRCRKTTHLKDIKKEHLFESDVDPTMRILIDKYLENDNISEGHNILTFDIEVEKNKETGYSTVEDANNKITSIAFHDSISNEYVVIILDELKTLKSKKAEKYSLISVQSEFELLQTFYSSYTSINPTIITGWNTSQFDIPYLYRRTVKVLGKGYGDMLSPINIVEKRFQQDDYDYQLKIAGVSSLDYLELYKNFTFSEESSYTLDAISNKELGRGKIEYLGDLQKLYETDIDKFVEYNMVDVELVVELDKKLKFINLARNICHKGHVPYESVFHSSAYLDGASLCYLKRREIVAPNKQPKIKLQISHPHNIGDTKLYMSKKISNRIPINGQINIRKTKSSKVTVEYIGFKDDYFLLKEPLKIEVNSEMPLNVSLPGAFVKQPVPGKYDWVYDLDLESLYPGIIRTLGISPETKVGSVKNFNGNDFVKKSIKEYQVKIGNKITTYQISEFTKFIKDNNYSISANGILYDKQKIGFIPSILTTWFNERATYKNKMKEFKKKGDKKMSEYFDTLQKVQKVLLNSFYGVLGLPTFRFYDVENASAITLSGQQIIKYTADIANHYYNRHIGTGYEVDIEIEGGHVKTVKGTTMFKIKREGEIGYSNAMMLKNDDEIIELVK